MTSSVLLSLTGGSQIGLYLAYAGFVLANAFGRRFAGGLLGQWFGNIGGSHVGRAVQALIAGATVAAMAPVWWWCGPVALGVFLGATLGFPRCGMVPRSAADVVAIAVRHGVAATLPVWAALVVLAPGQPWSLCAGLWLALAGLARGPAYWLAAQWSPHIPALGLLRHDPPPWAEFMSGWALGAALVLTFTWGG
jgi:hypothetical protein